MVFALYFRRFAPVTLFIFGFTLSAPSQNQDLPKAPQAEVFTLTPSPGSFHGAGDCGQSHKSEAGACGFPG